MNKMNFTPADDMKDELWGPIGTPERDAMEARLEEEIRTYHVGEAIKNIRLKQHLTQEELGEKSGVNRSEIGRLERGKSPMTLSTLRKVFRALGIPSATLDLGRVGKVPLW